VRIRGTNAREDIRGDVVSGAEGGIQGVRIRGTNAIRGAAVGEEAVVGSRLLRYGGKALGFARKVAFVVGAAVTVATATYHLSQGEYRAAAVDVADFLTLGGTSCALGKGEVAVKTLKDAAAGYKFIEEQLQERIVQRHPGMPEPVQDAVRRTGFLGGLLGN
jgi:hypothetical protein